jgi:hypothetical protein
MTQNHNIESKEKRRLLEIEELEFLVSQINNNNIDFDNLANQYKLCSTGRTNDWIVMNLETQIRVLKSYKEDKEDISNSRYIQEDYCNFITENGKKSYFETRLSHTMCCEKCGKKISKIKFNSDFLEYYSFTNYEESPLCCDKPEIKEYTQTEIEIKDNLILVNYFDNIDVPKEEKYSKYDMGTFVGREEQMNFFASNNIFYGQTGNMTLYVYKKLDSTEIILTESESKTKYKGYTLEGSIGCEVWRWMGADQTTINKLNLENNNFFGNVKIEGLPSGKWKMKHYMDIHKSFNVKNDYKKGIVSRLQFIN